METAFALFAAAAFGLSGCAFAGRTPRWFAVPAAWLMQPVSPAFRDILLRARATRPEPWGPLVRRLVPFRPPVQVAQDAAPEQVPSHAG